MAKRFNVIVVLGAYFDSRTDLFYGIRETIRHFNHQGLDTNLLLVSTGPIHLDLNYWAACYSRFFNVITVEQKVDTLAKFQVHVNSVLRNHDLENMASVFFIPTDNTERPIQMYRHVLQQSKIKGLEKRFHTNKSRCKQCGSRDQVKKSRYTRVALCLSCRDTEYQYLVNQSYSSAKSNL